MLTRTRRAPSDGAPHPPGSLQAPWFAVGATMFGIGWGANQFVSMLIAYREHAGISVGTSQALFGFYAVGLVITLLLGGPVSDARGRSTLLRPSAVLSVIATVTLMLGAHHVSLLYAGRFLAGIASGAVFAAGTAWVKELSAEPYEQGAGTQAGARRAAISLSLGFGLGPVFAGILAQWGPYPLVLPYGAHLVVMVLVFPGLLKAPETVVPSNRKRSIWPAGTNLPRFRGIVVPMGPWVFLSVSTAFAVMPGIVSAHTHGLAIAFAALTGGTALGCGVAVQPIARRLDAKNDLRGMQAGVACAIGGLLIAALAADLHNPLLVLLAAVPLGSSYGFCLVAGLLETQRLAEPDQLAGLTAVFYALTYIGFAGPLVLAELNKVATYPALLLCTAALGVLTLLVATVSGARNPISA